MKKTIVVTILALFTWFAVGTAYAAGKCPQPRKTKSAPANFAKLDKTGSADLANGKLIYTKKSKPMACKMCHGDKGDGAGKLGAALKPKPRNFLCSETMKKVSPGQMFWIIKNGSPATGMPAYQFLSGDEIWKLILYIRHFEKKKTGVQ